MGSLTIARSVSGPYRAPRAQRAPMLTTAGMFLFAGSVVAVLTAVVIGCA
jgi:hypothetical protein